MIDIFWSEEQRTWDFYHYAHHALQLARLLYRKSFFKCFQIPDMRDDEIPKILVRKIVKGKWSAPALPRRVTISSKIHGQIGISGELYENDNFMIWQTLNENGWPESYVNLAAFILQTFTHLDTNCFWSLPPSITNLSP